MQRMTVGTREAVGLQLSTAESWATGLTVTVDATLADGSTLATGLPCVYNATSHTYDATITAPTAPDVLTLTWHTGSAVHGSPVTEVEVLGARLCSVLEVRSLDGMEDLVTFPTAVVAEAIRWAEDVVADFCGSMWVPRLGVDLFRLPLREANRDRVALSSPLAESIRWVSIDGVPETDLSVYHLEDFGVSLFRDYRFPRSVSVEVGYEHGPTSAPEGVRWAARTLARHYLLALESRIPDRALSIQSDFGNIMLAQPGAVGRPTALPEVNAVLARYRVRGY